MTVAGWSEATWNVKLGAAALALPALIIGVIVGSDDSVPLVWRSLYSIGAVAYLAACWRWSRSHCAVEADAVTVVGIVRKRRAAADELVGAEVEAGGVPTLALHDGRCLRLGFLRAWPGRQRRRAEDFADAVNALAPPQ